MGEESAASMVNAQMNSSDGRESVSHPLETTGLISNDSSASRYHRASLGSYCDGDSSGRSSNSTNNKKAAIPNYLRASTGSCHDLCKYGRKHAVEEKPWRRPPPKRTTKQSNDQFTLGKASDPLERKMAKDKRASFPASRAHSIEDAIDAPEIIKHEVPSPSVKVEVPTEQELKSGKKMQQMPKTGRKSNDVSKKRSPVSETPKTETKSNNVSTKRSPVSEIPKAERKCNNVSTKCSPAAETIALKGNSLPASDTSEGKSGRGRGSGNIEDVKTVAVPKASPEKVLRPTGPLSTSRSLSLNLRSRKNSNLKLVSPLKDQKRTQKTASVKPKNEGVPEKILHVIKTETVNSPSQSTPKGDEVEEDDEEAVEEEDKIQLRNNEPRKLSTKSKVSPNMKEKKGVEGSRIRTLKNGVGVVPKDEDSSPMKFKFRRGKVVELQHVNNSPRKLRFRRAKSTLGIVDTEPDMRRTFKKKELGDDKDGHGPSTGKVALRHQDVQDKKDTQVLLNNVIEETVSKLVETRKSKVKALVGAFETVISSHDPKPTSQAVN